MFGCKKEGAKVVPTVIITEVTTVTETTATIKIGITSDGGAAITARGVCWSTTQNPTIADNKTSDGTGSGSFTSSITRLTPGSTNYVRAYASNVVGTAYGNEVSMTTVQTVANNYLPLEVGAKYKYNYCASYAYIYESSIKKGICTWTFISKSVDTPAVFQVEQSFSGYYVHRYYTGQRDSSLIENQITILNFEGRECCFFFPCTILG